MKRKYFIMIGIILLLAVLFIFFLNEQHSPAGQPTFKSQIEANQEEELTDAKEQTDTPLEKEDAEEEQTSNEQAPLQDDKPFPERISEVLETTLNFFLSNQTRVVAIGDSLTQGVGDVTNQGGYVGVLERTINENGEVAKFENYGKRGNRSNQLLKRLDEREIRSSIKKADIVLITIGANDIMQVAKENIMNLKLNDFIEQRIYYEQNLRQIVNKIRDLNGNAEIYLVGFYNPFEKYFQDIEELNTIVETYNSTTESIAEKNDNVMFIPTIDLFHDTNTNLFAEDNFHPNYLGYHKIAKRVLDYISNDIMSEES
ncbi:SGNH/GDSL hydrolase family protein [Oceanobacillus sp. Castelsardo]|uniref:SGNH/GDSL hydrolase family protein n=1 Tax=Oceanobacillus sp. Castelsardo TaxID=1851204 RepID=UPI0008389A90|nr:SGNH/GDSL hydrolase family protein [Oceanobacillus sp. Castelsardo]